MDDGQLHAYLDGELETVWPAGTRDLEDHLSGCPVCRARLSDAQRTRRRAQSVLRTGAPPEYGMPDFDALAARAAGRTAPPSMHSSGHRRALHRRAVALGWAASMIVALGAGWFAREARLHLLEPRAYDAREMHRVPAVRMAGSEAAPDAARTMPADVEAGSLSVDQFFSLYAALPQPEEFRLDPQEATEPLREWTRSHPELAQASPAVHILRWFWAEVERKRGTERG